MSKQKKSEAPPLPTLTETILESISDGVFANDRIAPVFDASRHVVLVKVESGNIIHKEEKHLPNALPVQKALRLAETNAKVLVCGAISRSMHEIVGSYGISIIPFVAGALEEVIEAWASGFTDWARFSMPGCRGGGRLRYRGRGNKQGRSCNHSTRPTY